jgi:hypothetical protein
MKYYKGKYRVKYPEKYKGDIQNVIYRSHWERQCFKWCENNSEILWWNSESLIIPYRCATDNKMHRYFIDLTIRFKNGNTLCVEIKPASQTTKPKRKQGKSKKRFLEESLTYAKNQSKWKAAKKYCEKRNWAFQVWTENELKSLGIKLLV